MARLFPLKGPLVTGGNVMDKTSEKVPERKDFVHPMYVESLRTNSTIVNMRNVNRAVKAAIKTAG